VSPRRFSPRFALPLIGLLICVGLAQSAFSQSQTLSVNNARVEITDLIKQIGEATQRTILFDDSVRGSVSIVAKRPVTLAEAWAMLGSALAVRGYTLLPSTEGIWRVSKVADAVGEAPFVAELDRQREAYVTTLIPLRIARAESVMSVLEPLAGASVTLVPFTGTNSLIASGPERRIARLTSLADALDRVDERPVQFIVIRHRSVEDMATWFESLFAAEEFSRRDVEIWSDVRTNSLIFRSSEADEVRVREFAAQLDQPIVGRGQIQVLRVLNRDAEEIAEVIRALGQTNATSARGSSQFASRAGLRSALTENEFSISVDPATRSLVVSADEEAHRAIREILEELDQPPQLIALDLKISELRTPSTFTLAFAFHVPLSSGDETGDVIARLVSTPGGNGLAATPSIDTTVFGRVDQELNVPFTVDDGTGIAIPISNTGVITAGNRTVQTRVLIEPSLVLTAGDAHEIFVGDNVPVPVQASSTTPDGQPTGANQNVLRRETTIERKDVGIKLGIEAQAGKTGPILLDLDVEISAFSPSIAGDIEVVGPTFREQNFIVNARLNDGEAAVIAINRDRRTIETRDGTPFLSSIPVLGWLFTSVGERDDDLHLVLAAKVRRVATPADLAADTIRRRLAFERRNARESGLPGVSDGETHFAVLVTTRGRRDDADAIAESLDFRGYATRVHEWELRDREYFDVYVTSLESMSSAAAVASTLSDEGWLADITLLPGS
jgi:type II secretion system protein D